MTSQNNNYLYSDVDPAHAGQVVSSILATVIKEASDLNAEEVRLQADLITNSIRAAFDSAGSSEIQGMISSAMSAGEGMAFMSMAAASGSNIAKVSKLQTDIKGNETQIKARESQLLDKEAFADVKVSKANPREATGYEEEPDYVRPQGDGDLEMQDRSPAGIKKDIADLKGENKDFENDLQQQSGKLTKSLNERQALQFLAQMLGNAPAKFAEGTKTINDATSQQEKTAYDGLQSVQSANPEMVRKAADAMEATVRSNTAISQRN